MRRGWPTQWILLLLWLVGAVCGSSAWGQQRDTALILGSTPGSIPLVSQAQYWIDEGGSQTIEQVEAVGDSLLWRPRLPRQRDRIDGQVLWIRFDATVRAGERWFLQIGSSATDRLQFYHRDMAGRLVRHEAGDRVPVDAWPVPGRVPAFALAAEVDRPVRYWLRVEHSRVDFSAPLTLIDQGTMLSLRDREQFLLGAYFGLAALFALAAVSNGLAYRDRAFIAYAVYVLLLGTGQLARLGIGAQHLWPQALGWNEASATVLPVLSTAAALWFVRTVTEPARFSMGLDLATWALVAASLAAVGLDAVVGNRTSLTLVLVIAGVAMVAIVALIATAWRVGHDRDAGLIALGFLPILVAAVFPLASGLNLLPVSALTRYGLMVGAVLEMPILYYALSRRATRRREADVRASALSHTDALTGLSNRGALLRQLAGTLHRARAQKQCCALLAVRIANLAQTAEEFGADAAEKAMVVAASHLRRAASDIDLAARTGDNEFVLLIETPTSPEAATSRAQQIVASGLRQAEGLPAGLTVKFQVAVALLPRAELDAECSLAWVAEGLAAFAPDSRKLIRPLNF